MEYLTELKVDNSLIAKHMYPQLERIYETDALNVHPSFEDDFKLLTDYLKKPGRGLGGSLVMRFAQLNGDETEHRPEVIRTAAATEVLNAYLLIIDDWLDNSDFRKLQPTIHKNYESYFSDTLDQKKREHVAAGQAVQLGMTALYLANIMILEEPFKQQQKVMLNIQRGALHVTTGNMLEAKISLDKVAKCTNNVVSMYANKTGYYSFLSPIISGLLLADVDDEAIKSFEPIGKQLGVSFQILDDLMGVFGDPARTGKPNVDDMREGLYTTIIDCASTCLIEEDYAELLSIHGNKHITLQDEERYRQLLRRGNVPVEMNKTIQIGLDCVRGELDTIWRSGWNQKTLEYTHALIDYIKAQHYD